MKRHKRVIEIVPATEVHIEELIRNMNDDCIKECQAFGKTPKVAAEEAFQRSDEAYTGLTDGRVGAVFGVVPFALLGSTGRPWMLSTELTAKEWLYTARASKKFIRHTLRRYERLENAVDNRYKLSIKWLKWLGFTVERPIVNRLTGIPVCLFHMDRDKLKEK